MSIEAALEPAGREEVGLGEGYNVLHPRVMLGRRAGLGVVQGIEA